MDNIQKKYIATIRETKRQNRLVVFVGSGVSANSGVPTWASLITSLQKDLPEDLCQERDALKVAQIYKDKFGHKFYIEKVREVLKHDTVSPNPIHNAILKLNPVHIITTNYDNLIEQAINENYKQFDVIAKDSDLPYFRYPNKFVKMHGDFDNNNIVLSEDEYYNYPRNFTLTRAFIQSLFASHVVLFIGFSFSDLNLKLILNDLKEILDKDMQRVYLLSDSNNDPIIVKYYESKGINIIDSNEISKNISLSEKEEKEVNEINNSQGKLLFKSIIALTDDQHDNDFDLFNHIYIKIKSFENEISTLGNGIKHIIPKSERPRWHFHSSGLQIMSPFIKKIREQLKTKEGQKKLVNTYDIHRRRYLKKYLRKNRIFEIDNVKISEIFDNDEYEELKSEAFNYFYSLDLEELGNHMKELNTNPVYYNKKDLLLPYYLFLTGNYYGAILIYKQLLPKYWEKHHYILYFICCYNLYNLRYRIFNQRGIDDSVDIKSLSNELNNIDLTGILTKLPIEQDIKHVLEDLVYSKIFSEDAIAGDNLKEEINKQRISAENGGASINSNIIVLISKFLQAFTFLSENCIIHNDTYFNSLCKDTVIGILNSHATPETRFDGIIYRTTRIEELTPSQILPILFFIQSSDLEKILKQYRIKNIIFSEEAIEFLNKVIDNLLNSCSICQNILPTARVIEYLNCIVLIASLSKQEDINYDSLYKIVLYFWQNFPNKPEEFNLPKILKRHTPSAEIAKEMLDLSMHRYIKFEFSRTIDTIQNLAKTLKEAYTLPISKKNLLKIKDLDFGLAIYKLLDSDLQKSFIRHFDEKSTDFGQYLEFHNKNSIAFDTVDFENRIKNIEINNGESYDFPTYNMLAYLVGCRKVEEFNDVHNLIDNYCSYSPLYSFLLSPLEYKEVNNIKPFWLLACDKNTIKKLLKNQSLKEKVKEYIRHDETGKLNYNLFFEML